MKRIILLLLAFISADVMLAQKEEDQPQEMKTIFGSNDKITHGGYGALMVDYCKIDGKDAVVVGGRGGWIINHRLVLGIGGKGIASSVSYPQSIETDKYYLNGGYGGLLIEPIIFPMSAVHISVPVIIGAGGAVYAKKYDWGTNWDDQSQWTTIDSSPFFVVEPGVEINLNLVKFMRISFGCYYRYTSGLNLENPYGEKSDDHILDGFSGGIALKFGKF
nr:hypothetical protein [Bacteroidota bacterium]